MIIYKLNEITKSLNELDIELNKTLDKAEEELKSKVNQLSEEEGQINVGTRYSEEGKKDIIKDLRKKRYEEAKKIGASSITEIEKLYNKYLEEVRKYVRFDDEQKEVRTSKVSDSRLNTEMLYATSTLKEVDDIDFDILIDLKEMYRENEQILKLINIKVKKLLRKEKYKNDTVLMQLKNEFEIISKNYVQELENRKNIYMDRYKTNNYTYKVFPHNLENLFKLNDDIINQFFN